jgi:hypothetical protein
MNEKTNKKKIIFSVMKWFLLLFMLWGAWKLYVYADIYVDVATLSESEKQVKWQEYYDSIDYSCRSNSDCVIKDVGNCCGYYPACTNKKSKVNRTDLGALCSGVGGACGFPSIDACRCNEKGLCEGVLNTQYGRAIEKLNEEARKEK